MGTFHSDKGALHGITVVVRTTGSAVYIGRCDTQTPHAIFLNDADKHEEGQDGKTNDEYVQTAAQWGHWPRIPQVSVPASEIASVEKLAELAN
ncbi:MAG: hypothetical protein H6839_04320 [Planctomycetes bacterium]|nr:hypothetical protein [Planctomycetota bacterium]